MDDTSQVLKYCVVVSHSTSIVQKPDEDVSPANVDFGTQT